MKAPILLRRAFALAALPLVVAFVAPGAQAQQLRIGFGKQGHHGSIGVSAGIGFGAPVCSPPIRVQRPYCAPQPVWDPGHYQDVERRVFVPGCTRQEYVPAVFEERYWRDYCGRLHVERVEVRGAYWRTVQAPGTWKCVTERVWVEGNWRVHAD